MGFIEEIITAPLRKACESSMLDMLKVFNISIKNASDNVTVTPDSWGGGEIFKLINTVHKEVFLPVGIALLTIFVWYEIYQMIADTNNMADFDSSKFFKLIIVTIIGVKFLANSMDIVMGMFDVGSNIVEKVVKASNMSANATLDFKAIKDSLSKENFISLLTLLAGLKISKLVFTIMGFIVWALIQIRMIQIYFYVVLSAVPMSTFVSRELRQVGINYLKNLLAYGLQGALIVLAFSVYRVMIQQSMKAADGGINAASMIGGAIMYGVILIVLIRKSNDVAKSIVEAH